jgi:DNA-binding CsgD family transcriptional regulator
VAQRVPATVWMALRSDARNRTQTDGGPPPGTRSRLPVEVRTAQPQHDEISDGARAVHGERPHVESRPSPEKQARKAWAGLTDTEQAVAELVSLGLTNEEVAGRIFLSRHTISFHLRKVYRKLGVGSRVELARFSIELGPEAHGAGRSARDSTRTGRWLTDR